MVGQIYPTELQLNEANSSSTEAPFLDLNIGILGQVWYLIVSIPDLCTITYL